MKITVVGAGYVGLSLATLLSRDNEVVLLDIIKEKLEMIDNRISPIKDKEIEDYFQNKELNLKTTLNYKEAFVDSKFIIIATPTDYNTETKVFDTKSIEENIDRIMGVNSEATIIIKSTVPIGYTKKIRKKYNKNNIIFSPEFLREGKALYDNLYPSRIIVGDKSSEAKEFGELLKNSALKKDVIVKYMDSDEAESVKLFSNTYLALRVSYFNELDTFAKKNDLNVKDIIDGVSLDPRIGDFYNNPSFGYGGYCLPKDTKQLLSNYDNIPQNLIESIIKSNATRKLFIASDIISRKPKLVGIYKLSMKEDSDNYRQSAILDIIDILKNNNIDMIIYDETIKSDTFKDIKVVNDLKLFKERSSIILANRIDKKLLDVSDKIYTRDIKVVNDKKSLDVSNILLRGYNDSKKLKTYLITGGAGFIGSNLTDRLLEDGNNVIAIDNFCSFYNPKLKEKNIENAIKYSNYKLYREDINDRRKLSDIFKSNKIDCVVHLAAQAGVRPSIKDPLYYEKVNMHGTINLLEEMKNSDVKKFLLASSSSVYGNSNEIPFNENMPTDRCVSPYAATKKADEVMSYVYHDLYGMDVIIPRFFTVYGPRQRPDLAISKFTDLIYNDKKIPMYGDGSTFRDYTYIDDIVDGIVKCVDYLDKEDVYEILNLGSSNPITLKRMIEVIAKELNKEPDIEMLDMQKGDVTGTYADITKAKELIGYEPKVGFEEGIKRFVKYYKNNRI